MVKVATHWIGEDGFLHFGGMEDIAKATAAAWCWVDVTDPDQATLERLSAPFGLHPLAVEDALDRQPRPKLDLYPECPFLAWLLPLSSFTGPLETIEVDFFFAGPSLVTTHTGVIEAVDEVEGDAENLMRMGRDWVVHAIIDRLTDTLIPIADGMGDRLEEVEDRMLHQTDRKDLDELYRLRRQLMQMHRIVSPQRDIVRSIARERTMITEETFRYYDDVVDHLNHVVEALDAYRDIGAAVMDIYLSAQSNRLNEVMKVLTVVTVLIGAATLISGIYGMNLLAGMWPSPEWLSSFWIVIGMMIGVAALLALVFKKMDWW